MNKQIFERFSIDDWIKLVNINKAIVSELQLDRVLVLILKNAISSIRAEHGSLMMIDENNKDELKIVASVGIPEHVSNNIRIKVGEGISGNVALNGKPVLIKDIEKDKEYGKKNDSTRYTTKSCISVPLIFKNCICGVFNINNKLNKEIFDEKDLEFAILLAQQAAIAIQNARLYSQVKRDKINLEDLNHELEESLFALSNYTEELYTFHEFTRHIFECVISYMDLNQLIEEICMLFFELEPLRPDKVVLNFELSNIIKAFKDGIAVELKDDEKKLLKKLSDYSIEKSESIRIPFEEERYDDFEKGVFEFYNSILTVPLSGKNGSMGTIILIKEKNSNEVFDEKSRNLMSIFSLQVSTALSLVHALNQIMEKKVVENELKVAAKIQRMFMPKNEPVVPGLEISHINIPTFAVGGDYIDFLWHDQDRLGIAVGDVSGKGVAASLIMALTKSAVKSHVSLFSSPKRLLEKINSELLSEIEGKRFVTMLFSFYSWRKRVFELSKAGHNPPLLLKKDGTLISINTQGLFLGMFRDCILREESYNLEKDDIMFMFTDGVIDAENSQGELFGQERMEKILLDNRDKSPEKIKNILIDELNSFSQGIRQKDDISLVICKGVDFYNREFYLPSNKDEINRLHSYLMNIIGLDNIITEELKFRLRLIIDEVLSNSIEHGNSFDKEKQIRVNHKINGDIIELIVEDEGKGFDWKRKLASKEVNIKSDRGRGLIILREMCEEFKFNEKGNEAYLKISIRS